MQIPLDFHNTINSSGIELTEYKGRAKSRQTEIYYFLKANAGKQFTPWQIYDAMFSSEPTDCIVSIRRSLCNLENCEPKWIKRTVETFDERRGVKNHKYYYE